MTHPESEREACMTLQPCPFCGEPAQKIHVAGSYGYYPEKDGYGCTSKKCEVQPSVVYDNEAWEKGKGYYPVDAFGKAMNAWNNRAHADAGDAARLAYIAENGQGIRSRYCGHRNLFVWDADYPISASDVLSNLRAAIDREMSSTPSDKAE
jgi:hypothetical protein